MQSKITVTFIVEIGHSNIVTIAIKFCSVLVRMTSRQTFELVDVCLSYPVIPVAQESSGLAQICHHFHFCNHASQCGIAVVATVRSSTLDLVLLHRTFADVASLSYLQNDDPRSVQRPPMNILFHRDVVKGDRSFSALLPVCWSQPALP